MHTGINMPALGRKLVPYCSETGRPMRGSEDGIYEDGEWVSWDWINNQLHKQDLRDEYPAVSCELAELFENLVDDAKTHHALTGRYLQIWGELGELYAHVKYGVQLHPPHTAGSDGRLGDDLVEIKTISPEKAEHKIQVKRSGNFTKLLIVKISADFEFESKLLDRCQMPDGPGKLAYVNWNASDDASKA